MSDLNLKDKSICICITGGIACYKAANLVSMLSKAGAKVSVAMTKNAMEFIAPLTFEALSHNAVITDSFSRSTPYEIEHIAFAKRADVMAVVPATANIIAKTANGIADDFVSTTLLATTAPTIFAPAMNTAMYNNPIVRDNIEKLKSYGKIVLETESGILACGDSGSGRMVEPEEIFEQICCALFYQNKDFSGKNVLVTAGPTIESIDDVRYLTNRSSGKMGYAIAKAAKNRGANVTLISGQTHIPVPKGIETVFVKSAKDMYEEVVSRFHQADILIKAAAVADYTPKHKAEGKIKKGGDLSLELKRTDDILASIGENKGGKIVVGFAAEATDVIENATGKLHRKNLDIIAANDISRDDIGFASEQNALTLLFSDGRRQKVEKCSKEEAANTLLSAILTIS